MDIKGNNDGIIGNGNILAGISKCGELIRMTYPSVDYKQIIDFFHVGVKINESAIIYLHEDINNHYEQEYINKTNILKTKIVNSYFNLEINQTDFVTMKKDLIIREYTLKNNNSIDLNIDFLIHTKLASNPENQISARVVNNVLLQYSYDNTFAIFSNEEIKSKQIHNSKDNINSGIIYGKDYIGMSSDSSISYDLGCIKSGEEKKICMYIYAKQNNEEENFEEIIYEIDKIKKGNSLKEYTAVKKYWEMYVEEHNTLNAQEIKEEIYNIYVRSILLFPLLTNKKTGGIIAALEADEYKKESGGYGYCWTRDAVFITKALDYLKMHTEVQKFYNTFCRKTQSKNGMWEQRFYTDCKLAPCWGYQIDETASVIYGIYEHYKMVNDVKFINNNMKMCEKAKDFLVRYIKNLLNEEEEDLVKKELIEKYGYQDEMHKQVSYDLWEMNEGVHLYSLSSIYSAFISMIKMYEILSEDAKSNRLKYEKIQKSKLELQSYSEKIKKFIYDNLHDDNQKILLRNTSDTRSDISILGSIIPFELFEANDKCVENTIEKINMTLRTYTGGYLRFEGDAYKGGANPWPIATLWMALYYIKCGKKDKAMECLNFVVNTSNKHGFLAEQVDNNKLQPNWVLGLGWSHAMFVITVNWLL